jgi:hypothetical protein
MQRESRWFQPHAECVNPRDRRVQHGRLARFGRSKRSVASRQVARKGSTTRTRRRNDHRQALAGSRPRRSLPTRFVEHCDSDRRDQLASCHRMAADRYRLRSRRAARRRPRARDADDAGSARPRTDRFTVGPRGTSCGRRNAASPATRLPRRSGGGLSGAPCSPPGAITAALSGSSNVVRPRHVGPKPADRDVLCRLSPSRPNGSFAARWQAPAQCPKGTRP